MKSERRHQLQQNELAQALETFPEKLKRHANKILLAITAVAVIFFLVRYRQQSQALKMTGLANAMAIVQAGPTSLKQYDLARAPSDQLAAARANVIAETNNAIDTVLRDATGDNAAAMRAEALLAKGDLNWTMAGLQELPGAATQPSLKLPRSREEYLKTAEDTYNDVIRGYGSLPNAWVSAELALSAIAENRHDWDRAKQLYNEILANKDVADVFKTQATLRLDILKQIQSPMLIGAYGAAATQAATQATQASGSAEPSTAPSAAPSPAPATQPAQDSFSITPRAPAASQP